MNVKKSLVVAAVSAFAAAGAFAQEVTAEELAFPSSVAATKTRAEVKAELAAARAQNGRLSVFSGEATAFPQEQATSVTRSRADVRNETISYLREHRFPSRDDQNIGG